MAKAKKTKPAAVADETHEVAPKGQASDQTEAGKADEVAAEVVAPPDNTADLLQRMWEGQIKALLTILDTTDPVAIPAATLGTIHKFLEANDIRAETVERRKAELARLQQQAVDFRSTPFSHGDGSDDYRRMREDR